MPQVEVVFDIDANGIVNVSAKDKTTGKEQSITITGGGSLSDDDVQRMIDEAKENEEADKQHLRIIEVRNKLDTLVYQTKKLIDENTEKLSDDTTASLSTRIETAEQALDSDDVDTMEAAHKELETVLHAAGQEMYAQASQEEESEPSPETPEEDVIDADYEETK
jgi:molecular chaperone DnaK